MSEFSPADEAKIREMSDEMSEEFGELFKEIGTRYEGEEHDFVHVISALHLGFMDAFANATGFVLACGMLDEQALDAYLIELKQVAMEYRDQTLADSKVSPTPLGGERH